jgi:hypothetical protein
MVGNPEFSVDSAALFALLGRRELRRETRASAYLSISDATLQHQVTSRRLCPAKSS